MSKENNECLHCCYYDDDIGICSGYLLINNFSCIYETDDNSCCDLPGQIDIFGNDDDYPY